MWGRFHLGGGGEKPHGERIQKKKMLESNDQSHYVYENKQDYDNFTERKGDIFVPTTDI